MLLHYRYQITSTRLKALNTLMLIIAKLFPRSTTVHNYGEEKYESCVLTAATERASNEQTCLTPCCGCLATELFVCS